jgi:hypothetical protein
MTPNSWCGTAARSAVALGALTVGAAVSARAQSVFDGELRIAPQFQSYHIAAPSDETVSQFALPVFVTIPFGPRFSMDVGTSYARARYTSASGISEVNGLTDTQVRGNVTLGSDFVVLTLGLNLPTGRESVTLDQFPAASRIGSDFLAFPISNMGTGFAATGGIAVARTVGDWSLGAGAAVRRSQSYEPFNIPDQQLTFQPGNEYRLRVGGDRPAGDGRVALGFTYSAFGQDDAGGSRYNVGDRVITQAVYTRPISGVDLAVGAYDVFRQNGHYASGNPSGKDNIANLFASAGFHPGGTGLVEPSLEFRHWQQEVGTPDLTSGLIAWRSQASMLATVAVRTRVELLSVTAFPSIGFTAGSLATTDAGGLPTHAGLTGFRAQIAMRVAPFAQ